MKEMNHVFLVLFKNCSQFFTANNCLIQKDCDESTIIRLFYENIEAVLLQFNFLRKKNEQFFVTNEERMSLN